MISPNQFWEHKNQVIVLEALHILKTKHPEIKFKVLFTGSLEVNRGKGLYIDKLKEKLKEYQIEDYIVFLGVIERSEQLTLIKHASAIIQPSLYEGWSTLVEEAKALNKFIILSDLPVHREQISKNVEFFDPHDANALTGKIINHIQHPKQLEIVDYSKTIKAFGENILNVLTA
jgi:glycosyltransferase involved in cell wall biosynthesis